MEDKRNFHLKVQEMIDCYAETDPLKEMSTLAQDEDKEEAALKWLGLVALHGINNNAEKISLKQKEGKLVVEAEYRESELPSPGPEVAEKIFEVLKNITHIEDEKGKTSLALGLRDSSVDLGVKIKTKEGKNKLSIKFPESE